MLEDPQPHAAMGDPELRSLILAIPYTPTRYINTRWGYLSTVSGSPRSLLQSATLRAHNTFQNRKPIVYFGQELAASAGYRNFDLRPDGSGVVALIPIQDDGKSRLHATFLLNFSDE